MALVSLTHTKSGESFNLDDNNIIQVYSLSSQTKVQYADVEAGIVKVVDVDETVSAIGGASSLLIALTSTESGATFYLNSSKISSVITEGSGAKIFFDAVGIELNTIVNETSTAIDGLVRPYKVYIAKLSQTGTSAPSATVLKDTLGVSVSWSRTDTGEYKITGTNAFNGNVQILLPANENKTGGAFLPSYIQVFAGIKSDASNITLTAGRQEVATGIITATDGYLYGENTIEIRVFS